MPASVHHRNVASAIVFGADFAGVSQTRLLLHRERVQFGAQHDHGPRAVLHDGHHAGAAHVLRDLVSQDSQLARHQGRSSSLVRREFRVLMQVQIQGVGIRKHRVHLVFELGVLGRSA